jgi:FAD/FMN-containing dehydrogenase
VIIELAISGAWLSLQEDYVMVTTIDRNALDPSIVEEFTSRVRGVTIRPTDAHYDEARSVFNGLIDRRPAVIVKCSGVADVVAAVNFAREHNVLLSVRGGGHNVAGNAVNDGGLVIDLSEMRGIRVDPTTRTARVQGGATWGDLDREAFLFGLTTPGGVISSTGVAGLTLHGGWGWFRRKLGYSLDNLRSVDIVTADGQVRTASATENPDLFWAVRGAGSNFGVVTSFEFQLHPIGPTTFMAAALYSAANAGDLLREIRAFMRTTPDEVSVNTLLWSMPPAPFVPAELHGAPIVIAAGTYYGPADEGERILMPLRQMGTPLVDFSHAAPYPDLQSGLDWAFPKGQLYYWKSLYLNGLEDDVIDRIVELGASRPSPETAIELWQLGGAPSRVPAAATAFGRRDDPFLLTVAATWNDPDQNRANIAWARAQWADFQCFSNGGLYLNFSGFGEEKEALLRAGYGPNYTRLTELKRTYDPTNLFRMNLNIRPAS